MERQKFCTQCRHPNRLEAKFCKNCGHRFKRVLLLSNDSCPKCHTMRRSGTKFCRNCGYEFVPSEAPVKHPEVKGVELPPPAHIPLDVPEIKPEASVPAPNPNAGIMISQEELGKIRRAKTEQIIFVPALRRKNRP
jgi:predicted Zn-ribbon and HTH transcriptional regulator